MPTRAERIGKRVTTGSIDRAETEASVQGGKRQAGTRLSVGAILNGASKILADQPSSFDRIKVDHRMRLAIGESLDTVRHRVDAGCRGRARRHAEGQRRIDNRDIGQHVHALDGKLGHRRGVGDEGPDAGLAAGA